MGGSEFYLWAGMTPFVPLCQQHREVLFRGPWPALGRACLKRKKEKKNPEQCLPSRQLLPTTSALGCQLAGLGPVWALALSVAGRAAGWDRYAVPALKAPTSSRPPPPPPPRIQNQRLALGAQNPRPRVQTRSWHLVNSFGKSASETWGSKCGLSTSSICIPRSWLDL